MTYLIDSHCHLDHRYFTEEGADVLLERARLNKVRGFLTVCCQIAELQPLLDIAEAHDDVWCSVGTHPHDASDEKEKSYSVEEIVKISKHPKIVAIGESGLDYFYKNSEVDDQKTSFRKHIQACQESGLPLIVHSRDAEDDTIAIMREELQNAPYKAVMHCFSSGRSLMEAAVDMGFTISFSGIVTFNRSNELREICKDVPLDRLLVETDSPYLAPQAYRGKRCEPAFVTHTARTIAEIHGISEKEIYAKTTDNFYNLFNKINKLM